MVKLKLYTTVTPVLNYVGINQIVTYWESQGWIERITIPMERDLRFISWVGRIGGLALEPSNVDRIVTPYEYVLACQYTARWKNNPKILPWNFYVRDWASYSKVRAELPLERKALSIFSGTIRQNHPRQDWKDSTEIYSTYPAKNYKRTNNKYPSMEAYYRALATTKFGLCPKGDIGVCQREIETMGMGCVPIFCPGVDWNYHVPPQENVHFIFANNPEEMKNKLANITPEQCAEMSKNGMEYFDKYVSPKGLWDTVIRTIETYNIKVN